MRATGAQGVIDVQNPNAGGAKHMKAKDMTSEPTVELSRREREELEKQRSKEDYERRHKEGKTDEFKKDMERLQQAKKRREEEEAKRASVAKANEEAQSRAKASTAAGKHEPRLGCAGTQTIRSLPWKKIAGRETTMASS